MSEYSHDREWEIPPEQRDQERAELKAEIREELEAEYQLGSPPARNENPTPEDEHGAPERGPIMRLLAPLIGFAVICLVSLLWGSTLFAGLIAYSHLGYSITGYVVLASVVIWMVGFTVIKSVLFSR